MCNHHDQTKQYNLCAVNAIKHVVPKQRGIGTLKHVIYQSHLSLGEYLHPAHQCEVCQKKFTCKKNLSQHKRIHKPDRYQCEKYMVISIEKTPDML